MNDHGYCNMCNQLISLKYWWIYLSMCVISFVIKGEGRRGRRGKRFSVVIFDCKVYPHSGRGYSLNVFLRAFEGQPFVFMYSICRGGHNFMCTRSSDVEL